MRVPRAVCESNRTRRIYWARSSTPGSVTMEKKRKWMADHDSNELAYVLG